MYILMQNTVDLLLCLGKDALWGTLVEGRRVATVLRTARAILLLFLANARGPKEPNGLEPPHHGGHTHCPAITMALRAAGSVCLCSESYCW